MSFSIQFSLYAIHMIDLYNLINILFQGMRETLIMDAVV